MSAIVVGHTGQDGRILVRCLRDQGRAAIGIGRESIESFNLPTFSRIDITRHDQVSELVRNSKPDQIYYLAAHHHSSQDKSIENHAEVMRRSLDVHVIGLMNCLEAMRVHSANTRLFYAASSHVFGECAFEQQNEMTPFNPTGIYGITKVAGIQCCRLARRNHNLFTSVGILYNHESQYRRADFVSRKIIDSAIAIARGKQDKLIVGDLSSRIDWGYAPDFVNAMMQMMELSEPDDFVVATGESHSVRDFVAEAFGQLGLDYRQYVEEDSRLIRKSTMTLVGDASKLRQKTGWRPSVTFAQMISALLKSASENFHQRR